VFKLEFKWYVYLLAALVIYMAYADVTTVGGALHALVHLFTAVGRGLDHALRAVQHR
jgi:hypothetical protein